jgi:predicted unusual protein kinase regulating ubiquinone biosynthesis (AarF/ABC1/UbiB family)
MEFMALREAVEEFAFAMSAQVDLRYEARNLCRFSRNFARDKRITFPRPLRPELCDRRVLVETFGIAMLCLFIVY